MSREITKEDVEAAQSAEPLKQEVVEAAFEWLHTSSVALGRAKAQLSRTKFRAAKTHARLFLHATGSIESRKAQATVSDEYEAAMEAHFEAEEVWTRMEDQKDRANSILDCWRTTQANERGIMKRTR